MSIKFNANNGNMKLPNLTSKTLKHEVEHLSTPLSKKFTPLSTDTKELLKAWDIKITEMLISKLKKEKERLSHKTLQLQQKYLKSTKKTETTPHISFEDIKKSHHKIPEIQSKINTQFQTLKETYPNIKFTRYQATQLQSIFEHYGLCLKKESDARVEFLTIKEQYGPNDYKVHIEDYKVKKAHHDTNEAETRLYDLLYAFHQVNKKRKA